eukprot:gene26163-11890_t
MYAVRLREGLAHGYESRHLSQDRVAGGSSKPPTSCDGFRGGAKRGGGPTPAYAYDATAYDFDSDTLGHAQTCGCGRKSEEVQNLTGGYHTIAEESLAAEAAKKRSRRCRPSLADKNAAPSDRQPGMVPPVHWPLQSPCHTLLPECTGLDQHEVLGNLRLPDDNAMPAPSCTFTLPMPSPSSELPPLTGCCPPSSAPVPQPFYSCGATIPNATRTAKLWILAY